MSTVGLIRREISKLEENELISTRELLHLGTRAAVDGAIQRLVRIGELIRLAWGMFVRPGPEIATIDAETVAIKKAAVFGKKLIKHELDAAHQLGLTHKGNRKLTYATQGSTSSFRFLGKDPVRVYVRRTSKRKFLLGNKPVGLAIRGLWRIGRKAALCPKAIESATALFGRKERREFNKSARWMPHWLSDYIYKLRNTPSPVASKPACQKFKQARRCSIPSG